MFDVFEVVARPEMYEAGGLKPKFWFADKVFPEGAMFKHKRIGTGEDWAEKIACELCRVIRLPHARYELATCTNATGDKSPHGTISPNFVPQIPQLGRLVVGNEFLTAFNRHAGPDRRFHAKNNTLRNIVTVMRLPLLRVPRESVDLPLHEMTPLDVFVGYVMLDAWIANQDRHNENWGIVIAPDNTITLAPTYDHASSLGRNESDSARKDRLTTKDRGRSVENYVARARSAIFQAESDTRAMTTLEAFVAAARLRPQAGQAWLCRLGEVSDGEMRHLLEKIPENRISGVGIEFALSILLANKSRLLELRAVIK